MKPWICYFRTQILKEWSLISTAKDVSDYVRIGGRVAVVIFLLAFKWVIPVVALALIRLLLP